MSEEKRKPPPPVQDYIVIGTYGPQDQIKRQRVISCRTIRSAAREFVRTVDEKAKLIDVDVKEGFEIIQGAPHICSNVFWSGSSNPIRVYCRSALQ